MPAENLQDLLVETLRDTLDAEKQLVKALPKMAKAATSPDLKAAFTEHLAVTKGQVTRLEKVFEEMGIAARGKHCVAMEGLIEEGSEMIEEEPESVVLDAGLIAAAQKVEHYEIAAYGTCRTWANLLGHNKVADLLSQTLDEEAEADEKLTTIAEGINVQAEVGEE